MGQAERQFEYLPRAPRWASNAKVCIVDDCGQEIAARLGNISEGGFMADCEEKVRLGSVVEVKLPDRGWVRAEVRWVLGWRFGGMVVEQL